MKILIPVAAYHEYNTAVYVAKAFTELGHSARVITQAEFYGCTVDDADLFFGVDSAGPLDFPIPLIHKTSMWFIDSRHNNNPERRKPDDDTNARKIADNGGWVLQAQRRDWKRNVDQGILRSCWLPLAADPDTWAPLAEELKTHEVGFGGNIWCNQRREALDKIAARFKLSHVCGKPYELAANYCHSHVGFNISGWFGTDIAYDINMRVFEVMSCGVPLVTNQLSELQDLGFVRDHHYLGYSDVDGALSCIRIALSRGHDWRKEVGDRARQFIKEGHTYAVRMAEALELLELAGIV